MPKRQKQRSWKGKIAYYRMKVSPGGKFRQLEPPIDKQYVIGSYIPKYAHSDIYQTSRSTTM